ncbi:F0F1 ATP synthase subunit delta [Alphaproteobacteria bacterium GH1-50]|uniref:ATP synthase subunit delta n=1 Tax=Kangsaoukella pontilimi TaxID=2691042 RepID=A0A7C9N141_9RHOB|nr:F0F1 ATP synthase subunit delta [Kangsaoukella pontilimi]MXQ08498.1 F0F1 ATP synthase subunit delta [Kangsaoukella pontilimi]
MSESASQSTGVASRYAMAVFELAKENGEIDALERDIAALDGAIADSADFRDLIHSPIYSRDQQSAAVAALADKMGLTATVANTLKLMASKRRLFVLPHLLMVLKDVIAEEKGIVTAEVRTARPLSDEQAANLEATLKDAVGKDVTMQISVDESLIGGLIVKVGSKMIDTSIKSKLAALQNTMKEVG